MQRGWESEIGRARPRIKMVGGDFLSRPKHCMGCSAWEWVSILVDEYWSFGPVCCLHFQVLLTLKMQAVSPPPRTPMLAFKKTAPSIITLLLSPVSTTSPQFTISPPIRTTQVFNLCSTLCSVSCLPSVPVLCMWIDAALYKWRCGEANFCGVVGHLWMSNSFLWDHARNYCLFPSIVLNMKQMTDPIDYFKMSPVSVVVKKHNCMRNIFLRLLQGFSFLSCQFLG
jgi:hypothetical protein